MIYNAYISKKQEAYGVATQTKQNKTHTHINQEGRLKAKNTVVCKQG